MCKADVKRREGEILDLCIDQRSLALSEAELSALPRGIIRLDKTGSILYHEGAALANARGIPTKIGLNFFRDVAPCEPVQDLQGRFDRFVARPGSQIEAYTFWFRYDFGDRRVTFTMVRRGDAERSIYVVASATPIHGTA